MTPGQASAAGALITIHGGIAAHVFDLPDGGTAFIDHGWADGYPGGGQPCHRLPGEFEPFEDYAWIAPDTEYGDIILLRYDGPGKADGTRAEAKRVLEAGLDITIP